MARKILSSLALAMLFSTRAAMAVECAGEGFEARFDDGSAKGGFAAVQEQNGTVRVTGDPVTAGNGAVLMDAGAKSRGRVGKAGLIHRFSPVGAGQVIEMEGRFLFPRGAATDSVILMDLECASCNLDTNPGIRLYLRDGRLRVDRSKIGIEEPFYPSVDIRVKPDRWQTIRWTVRLGGGEAGRSQVALDGRMISNRRGTTLLSQEIVSQIANIEIREQVDRFQIGLTANSNSRPSRLLLDDVRFCIRGG